jgi:SAM-dependent methyltransferase
LPGHLKHRIPEPIRQRARRWRNLRAARGATAQEVWAGGADAEIAILSEWLRTQGGRWPGDYRFRLDPESVIQEDITRHLNGAGQRVRLLDAGAGPLTFVGKRWPGHDLELTAVDALADSYDALLAEYAITPPVRTRRCDSERLSDVFAPDSFDMACAAHTIDHSYEPLRAIRQLVTVVRPGGVVLLQHYPNEAENEVYSGQHQWNLDWVSGDCILWRPGDKWSLRRELAGQATVTGGKADDVVTTVITKSGGPTAGAERVSVLPRNSAGVAAGQTAGRRCSQLAVTTGGCRRPR